MDPINPDLKTPPTISPTPKPSILLLILSIFLIISLAGIGILVYQNKQLQKQISALRSQPTPTPTPPPQAKPDLAPPDTANWKTHTDTKYSFKYPSTWTNKQIPVNSFIVMSVGNKTDTLTLSLAEKLPGLGLEGEVVEGKVIIDGKEFKKWTPKDLNSQTKSSNQVVWISLGENTGDFLTLYDSSATKDNPSKAFDQILSTFKFLDQSSDPEGRFCGGIAANLPQNQCPEDYTCKLENEFPDAGGVCTKKL